MKRKLIVTKQQHERLMETLTRLVSEDSDLKFVVNEILADLNSNYKVVRSIHRGYDDYYEKNSIEVKFDGRVISPKQLLEYMKKKYSGICGENFIKQLIKDWASGDIRNGSLSKHVSLND